MALLESSAKSAKISLLELAMKHFLFSLSFPSPIQLRSCRVLPLFPFCLVLILAAETTCLADWPQWRGPLRNGLSDAAIKLAPLSDESQPEERWTSYQIPSDHYGGHGSLAVSKGKVIVAIVWHRDEPTEKRRFTSKVLGDLGYRNTKALDPAVVEKMEADRLKLSRRLRGKALNEYVKKWVEENLDQKTQLSLGGWIGSRFKKGPNAIPLSVLQEISNKSNDVFANQAELEAWVAERDWTAEVKEEVLSKVPDTEKHANDVVVALDAENGEEAWRFEVPGRPSGRVSSSTPAVSDGRIYAALSTHLYCIDESNGKEIWKTPLNRKGLASSPLVAHGKVYLQQNSLTAFDAKTGELLWENRDVRSSHSSPNIWKNIVTCNGSKSLFGVDADTGETKWTAGGGGDATPVISGDFLVLASRTDGKNLSAYRLTGEGPEKLWTKEFVARRYGSSPIIFEGYVYHLGSTRHWCIHLESGEVAWERTMQSQISSPVLADGKLLVYENRGGLLSMIEATPEDYVALGKAKVGALYCASPAIVGNDVYFRTKDMVKCIRLP